jgi:predicted HicB family RNase H-like nuclease
LNQRSKTRKVGRPPLPKNHAKARIVPVRFTPEEFRAITAAAKASKQSLSEWIRGTLDAKVKS